MQSTQIIEGFWRSLGLEGVGYEIACFATTHDPQSGQAWWRRGCAESQRDWHKAAINSLLHAADLDDRLHSVWMVLALEWALTGQPIHAQDAAHRALLMRPDLAPCAAYVALIFAESAPEIATDLLVSAMDYGCLDDSWWRAYVRLLGAQGRNGEALQTLQAFWSLRSLHAR